MHEKQESGRDTGDVARSDCEVELLRTLLGAVRAYEATMTPRDISLPQFHVLDRLASSPEGLHQEKLVRYAETGKSSAISSLLRKMEYEYDWISREVDKSNRRKVIIKLKAKGKRTWERAVEKYRSKLHEKLRTLPEGTMQRLRADLSLLGDSFAP